MSSLSFGQVVLSVFFNSVAKKVFLIGEVSKEGIVSVTCPDL